MDAGPCAFPVCYANSLLPPAAMAYVARTKRSFDIADLREVGQSNKRAKTNAIASKTLLDTEDARKLLHVEASIAAMDDVMEGMKNTQSLVQTSVDDLRFAPVATLDDQHVLELCRVGLTGCENLKADWAAANVLSVLRPLVAQHAVIVVPEGAEERRSLLRRIAYYRPRPSVKKTCLRRIP